MQASIRLPVTANSSTMIERMNLHCERNKKVSSRGFFGGDDPTQFSVPLLLLQLSMATFLSGTMEFLLKPLGQPKFVSKMIAGLTLGPSCLSHNEAFKKKLFPAKSIIALDVYAIFACMFFMFLDGVRMDVGVVKKTGKLAVIIGFSSFLLPLILTASTTFYILNTNPLMDKKLLETLPFVAALQSSTSFHVVYSVLTDLKLLNSELGRLAISSSLISGACGWLLLSTIMGLKQSSHVDTTGAIMIVFCRVFIIIIIIYVFRPIMLWMMRQTPQGKTLREGYICAIILMLLGCALFGEVTGQRSLFGPVVLGLSVPNGPHMGPAIEEKLECFVSVVLLPMFIITAGLKVNVFIIRMKFFGVVELIIFLAFLGKLIAAMLPSLYCKMPFLDALSLGLLLNFQGLFDINYFSRALDAQFINDECFSIMTIMTVLHSVAFTPLIRALYDPSRKYVAYKRRTIQHAKHNMELRILACVHNEDNVPTIINILEASNPTRESPICVYVLHLSELAGRASPLLVPHKSRKKLSSQPSKTERIVKAFNYFEQTNEGQVTVQCFTGIAPYDTMHDDVCALALDKRASLVIIPFHTSAGRPVRGVNQNILAKAPCSVGILIDRGMMNASRTVFTCQNLFRVAVIFLGGPDDREALAYATRMGKHPGVNLTVVRLLDFGQNSYDVVAKKLDGDAINAFRIGSIDNDRIVYREEEVTDGSGTASVIRSMHSYIDLMLVGRRQDTESPLLLGLTEWSEFYELGIIGDILASSDFMDKVSVLVVQQQASVIEEMVQSPNHSSQLKVYDSTPLMDISRRNQMPRRDL